MLRAMPLPRLARHRFLALVAACALVLGACGGSDDEASDQGGGSSTTVAPAGAGGETPTTVQDRYLLATAAVTGPVEVFAEPDAPEPQETISNPTPYGLVRTFLVDRQEGDWLLVHLPKEPNFQKGWIRAGDVTLSRTDYKLVVTLGEYNLKLYDGDEVVLDVPVGVAQDTYPTPPGLYFITDLTQPPDPNTVYGTYAYGLSGYSEALPTFNGGDGQLGIHGTNKPESIGKNESHGCIRLHNADIEKLVPLLQLGTPVEIVA